MGSLNKVQIIGNLTRDPDVRRTNDGKPIANVTVASSESWKDQQGVKQERTEYHRVVVFGGLAEIVEKYLKKGSSVYFEGKLQTRKWTDKQGVDKYSTEVIVDIRGSMQMLGGKNQETSVAPVSVTEEDDFEDDIPF